MPPSGSQLLNPIQVECRAVSLFFEVRKANQGGGGREAPVRWRGVHASSMGGGKLEREVRRQACLKPGGWEVRWTSAHPGSGGIIPPPEKMEVPGTKKIEKTSATYKAI